MNDWIREHATAIGWIGIASAVMLVASAIIVPWIVIRIPSDFFAADRRPPSRFAFEHPAIRLAILIIRNILGSVLVLAGIAMLVLPGQGLLTLAMGVVMLDFPKKHVLERWIIRLPPVLRSINWLRRKANVAPLRTERSTPGDRAIESADPDQPTGSEPNVADPASIRSNDKSFDQDHQRSQKGRSQDSRS